MKNLGFFLIIAGLAFACSSDDEGTPQPQPVEFSTYINSGGAAIGGTDWVADKDFTDGTIYPAAGPVTAEIANTDNDALYQIERNSKDFPNGFSYEIDVPANGPWDVELHFAEIFHEAAGARIFDVSIEGQLVLDDYDIFAEAGAKNTAIVETFSDVDIQDGNVTIEFTNGSADNAKISGIGVSGSYLP